MPYQIFAPTSFDNIKISSLENIASVTDVHQKIHDSLARLAADPKTGFMISAIQTSLHSRGINLYMFSENTDPNGGDKRIETGSLQMFQTQDTSPYYPEIPIGSLMVYIEAEGSSNNAFDGINVHGLNPIGDFESSLDRTIYHELVHAWVSLSDPTRSPEYNVDHWTSTVTGVNGASFSFSEDISVAAENFFYNTSALSSANGDNGIRIGHITPEPLSGVPPYNVDEESSNGFALVQDLFTRGAEIKYDLSGSVTGFKFFGKTTDALSPLYSKTHYAPGYNPLGSGAASEYDHYIIYRTEGALSSIGSTTNGQNYYLNTNSAWLSPYFQKFTQGVMAHDIQGGMDIAAKVVRNALSVFANSWGYTDRIDGGISYLDNFVGIGSDRFTDSAEAENGNKAKIDISGPVQSGSTVNDHVTTSPVKLAINDSQSNDGTLILGASGFQLEGDVLIPFDDYIDATSSYDWILGGTGHDLIIAGIGAGPIKNSIHGGGGQDVIIGRESSDDLFGGIGNDLIRPGAGNDDVHGGSGVDTVTYFDSTSPITIDMRSKTGTRGDASGDTYTQVEAFLGTPEADIFYGAGAGHFFWGGEGNDEFYLKNGDYAKGGAGADRFYLEIEPGKTVRVGIIDLDTQDSVFVNGVQLTGSGVYTNGTFYNLEASRYGDTAKLDLTSFGMYGSSNPISITTTMFDTGDGGISPYYYGSSSYIPFNYGTTEILM